MKQSITTFEGKVLDVVHPRARLGYGKHGMKLEIIRDGNFVQRTVQRLNAPELRPVTLEQSFVFSPYTIGFWQGDYAILIRVFRETSFHPETIGNIKQCYLFFGIDGTAKPVPLGVADHPSLIQKYLRSKDILVHSWYPIHELPEHIAENTCWTDYTIHSCLLRMHREHSHIVLVQGE